MCLKFKFLFCFQNKFIIIFTYGTLFSSLAFWTGAIEGVEIDFCNGIRQIVGAKFLFAFNFSKSLCNKIKQTNKQAID